VEAAAELLGEREFAVSEEAPPDLSRVEPIFARMREADGLPLQLLRLTRDHEDLVTDNIRDLLRTRHFGKPDDLRELAGELDVVRARVLRFMERNEILLMPVASVPAYRPDLARYDLPASFDVDGEAVPRLKALSCSAVITALGLPAVVVPFGSSEEGLPVGVQVVGRPFRDRDVLFVARALSAHQDGKRPAPLRVKTRRYPDAIASVDSEDTLHAG
jgi:Asp-tRNA(Asn)/Glu-tRNA(Gln) amidotransferase A subunit family amidase